MNPTPEQVAQWAREAGISVWCINDFCPECGTDLEDFQRFATLVAAWQAEQDQTTCDAVYHQNIGPSFGEVRHGIAQCKVAIRANAPKVTT
jgi:hypothetical protein